MTKLFHIEGLDSKKSATAIIEAVKKIVGVEEAQMDLMEGELALTLERPNGLIFLLVQHIVQKEDSALVLTDISSK